MNVLSNIPFVLLGTAGLWMIRKRRPYDAFEKFKTSYTIFLVAIFFTGVGSAFYHLNPTDFTLIWDRLPMTVAFMAFFSIVTGTMVNPKFGNRMFWPLIGFGLFSILFWTMNNDLRFYALVQFLPMLLIPLILIFYKSNQILKKYFWLVVVCYGFAKLVEALDSEIFLISGVISGHSIKHLLAAMVPLLFILSLFHKTNIREFP